MRKEKIPANWVKGLFNYDRESGQLTWRVAAGRYGRIAPGTFAGTTHEDKDGYKSRSVNIDGIHYRTTHLIWAWMTGEWPKRTIDHKNCNSLDDRWKNLREAGYSEQKQNTRIRKDNKTGYKCIVHDKERDQYRWQVVINGKRTKGKRFKTAKEAYADYCSNLKNWHGKFANNGAN